MPDAIFGSVATTRIAARQYRAPSAGTRPGAARDADRAAFSPTALRLSRESSVAGPAGPAGLSDEQQAQVRKLAARDVEVRAHEQAHRVAGGQLVLGTTHYEYESGPDGGRYAVGGEVQIDTNPVPGDPEATLARAEQIVRAALAPAQPSGADRAVAAKATAMAARARADAARQSPDNDHGGRDTPRLDRLA